MEINEEFFAEKIKKYKNILLESQKYLEKEFVVFDLETTGLDYTVHHITEIGGVKIKNGKVIDSFQSFCALPIGRSIPPNVVKLTGITDFMLKDAPDINVVLKSFYQFIGDAVLIGQNSNNFDMPWIIYNYAKLGIILKNDSFDTLLIGKYQMPLRKSYNLKKLTEYYNVMYDGSSHHRADYDAELTAKVFYAQLKYAEIPTTMVFPEGKDVQFLKNLIGELFTDCSSEHIDLLLNGIKAYHIKPLSQLYSDAIKRKNN